MNQAKEFSHLELRPRKDEKCVTAYQDLAFSDDEYDELRETDNLNISNAVEDSAIGIDKQTSSVAAFVKRAKSKNVGSNGQLIKSCKKLKAGMASNDLSLSNGGQCKEASNPPDVQAVDGTEKLLFGNLTSAKQENGVKLKHPLFTFARKKGKSSADASVPKALLKVAGDSTSTTKPKTVKEKGVTKSSSIPIVLGMPCDAMPVSRSNKSKRLISTSPQNASEPETPQSGVPLAPKITGNQAKETNGDSMTKRKRRRPSKSQCKKLKTSSTLNHQNGDAHVKELTNKSEIRLTPLQERYDKPVKRKRTKRRMMSLNSKSLPQDLQGKSLCSMADDRAFPKWSVSNLESAGKKPTGNVELNGNDQQPSFKKQSSLWEAIESTEAFRRVPQNPHFRPLDNLPESARENQAIYKMVDYSRVYEDMSRLQVDNPRREIVDRLKTLSELETHGFDVGHIRTRLMELLSLKEERENKELESISNQLNELTEKRDQLLKEKVNRKLKIISLGKQADKIKEADREICREFEELARAPF